MNKRERISQFLAEAAEEDVDPHLAEVERHPYYRAFFRCWNEQQYYEAHDVLEQLWLKAKTPDSDFFKGLIQAAGAFVHLQKHFEHPSHAKHSRRLPPAVRLFRLAQRNLANFTAWHHALDVIALCQLLNRYADEIVASNYTINPWSPETAPKLKVGAVHPKHPGD
jgi:predicted metal-dependent hydrolase